MSRNWKPDRRTLPTLITLAVLHTGACGTDAVAVDTCRRIESARCEAAAHCGDRFGLTNVGSCQRFYDAQCLHGFAADDAPGVPDVNRCVATIRAAGECAREDGEDATCNLDAEVDESLTACDLVAHPEKASTCAFLEPSAEEESGDDDESSAGAGGKADSPEAAGSGAGGGAGASGHGGDAD